MAKLAEGTDIVYKDADELATAVNQRLTRFAGLTSAKSPARKLNRLAGQLQAKIALLRAHKPAKGMAAVPDEFLGDLNKLLAFVVEPKPGKDILELCGEILSSFSRLCRRIFAARYMALLQHRQYLRATGLRTRPARRLRQGTPGAAR